MVVAHLVLVKRRTVVNVTLLKALVALVPVGMLFSGSVVLFAGRRTVSSLLQLLGVGCLVVVVLSHVCEALHLFPWMNLGLEHSVVITSICGALSLASFCFPSDISSMRLQSDTPNQSLEVLNQGKSV